MRCSQQKRKRTEALVSPELDQAICEDVPAPKKACRKTEIVIGIDWGTTWTGVAWTLVSDKTRNESNKINVIQQWPAGSRTSDKVPTEFVYTKDGTWETMKWGFQAQAPNLSLEAIRWTKLLLDQDYANLVPEAREAASKIPHNKAVVELVKDYLSALRTHIEETLVDKYGLTFWKRSIVRYILTVPAIWSEKAKETHLEAAEKAGYGKKEALELISEPQAAAIAAFKVLGNGSLRRYDCFTVVDCGGGTVDLISYKIMNFRPQTEFREVTLGEGGACGSIFINKEFESYIIKRFGSKVYELLNRKSKARMIAEFELVKQSFSDDHDQDLFPITALGLPRKVKGGVGVDEDSYLNLNREIIRGIFDPTIESILKLIRNQITAARAVGQRIKMILLVGGFGGSPYLLRRVREWVSIEALNIEVTQPPDAWTAIARGAVMHGINNQIVKDTIARRSYGVCVDKRYREGLHPSHVKYFDDYDNIWRVKDQMDWFILKGVRLNGNKNSFKIEYCQHLPIAEFADPTSLKITDMLYVYDGDDAPDVPNSSGVRQLCELHSDLNSIPKEKWKARSKSDGTSFYTIEFDFVMEVEGEKLLFGLEVDGVRYSAVSTKFR